MSTAVPAAPRANTTTMPTPTLSCSATSRATLEVAVRVCVTQNPGVDLLEGSCRRRTANRASAN
jgi:hypothetical protein